ncbi:hypothetical protein AB0D49_32885 [Streptomyces sp. NPDC048290]
MTDSATADLAEKWLDIAFDEDEIALLAQGGRSSTPGSGGYP